MKEKNSKEDLTVCPFKFAGASQTLITDQMLKVRLSLIGDEKERRRIGREIFHAVAGCEKEKCELFCKGMKKCSFKVIALHTTNKEL